MSIQTTNRPSVTGPFAGPYAEPLELRQGGICCSGPGCLNTTDFIVDLNSVRFLVGEAGLIPDNLLDVERGLRVVVPFLTISPADADVEDAAKELLWKFGLSSVIPESIISAGNLRCLHCGSPAAPFSPEYCSCVAGCDKCARLSNEHLFREECLYCILDTFRVCREYPTSDICRSCYKGNLRRRFFDFRKLIEAAKSL